MMRFTTLPILALVLSSAGHPTSPSSDAPAQCKTPAIADCLHLLDLISSPDLKGLSFPIRPEGFSPVAYYGDCALAAVHTDGVVGETLTQMWGEAAEVVRDMVGMGPEAGEELPIVRDVESGNQRGTFSLVLTASAGDIGAWKDTVDGCIVDAMAGRGRAKPVQDQPPAFSPDIEDQYRAFHSEQQSLFHRLPTCGLAGIPSIDGSQYGCNAQAIPSPPPNYQGDLPSAMSLQGNPFAQLIARCPRNTHWKCITAIDSVTCYCIASNDANVTQFETLSQLLPDNNQTVISLFDLKCAENEIVSCFRIVIRQFQCGCYYQRQSLALELDGYDRSQISDESSDILFASIKWPTCKEGEHLKCCPGRRSWICSCGKGIGCPKKKKDVDLE
jgi:hypothetical protein